MVRILDGVGEAFNFRLDLGTGSALLVAERSASEGLVPLLPNGKGSGPRISHRLDRSVPGLHQRLPSCREGQRSLGMNEPNSEFSIDGDQSAIKTELVLTPLGALRPSFPPWILRPSRPIQRRLLASQSSVPETCASKGGSREILRVLRQGGCR